MDNSFSKAHPELVAEWSERNLPVTPDDITYGSNRLFWWKGPCGHEWQASVKARHAGEKCPICANVRVVPGINDLGTTNPDLASQWSTRNESLPSEVTGESHRKVWWHGPCGHEWQAEIRSRTKLGNGCPFCASRKLLKGFNDLATRFPEVAEEWSPRNSPLQTDMVMAFANRKAWWRCRNCGNEWNTLISTRSGGSKCPFCSGLTLLPGFNDLKTRHPAIAAEWSERNQALRPDAVNEKSRRNVWWKCASCGHEYRALIRSRVKGVSCPACANRTVEPGFNDLATTDPDLLREWNYERNGVHPGFVSRLSHQRVWWKCRFGHHWSMKISDRTVEGKCCTVCDQGFASVLPELAVLYYAGKRNLHAEIGSDQRSGIPISTVIPEIGLAVDFVERDSGQARTEQAWKRHYCSLHNISLIEIRIHPGYDRIRLLQTIKQVLRKENLFIRSDEEADLAILRRAYEKLQGRGVR